MAATLIQQDIIRLSDLLTAAFPTVELLTTASPTDLQVWFQDQVPPRSERTVAISLLLNYIQDNAQFDIFLSHIYMRSSHTGLCDFICSQEWFKDRFKQTLLSALGELLPQDEPFINREVFRDLLTNFLDPQRGPRRLLVVPPSASVGKSHSRYLMRHVAKALDLSFVYVNCANVRSGLEAARLIANELGLDAAALDAQLRDQSRPGLTFKGWLKGKLELGSAVRKGWVVFDHVNKPKSSDEVESIALALAEAAAEGELTTVFITLIDSDYEVTRIPFGHRTPVLRDQPATPLSTSDISTFYRRWAQARNKPVPQDLDIQVEALFTGLPQPLDRSGTTSVLTRLANQLAAQNLL